MHPRTLSLVRAARIASRFQAVRCSSDVALHGPTPRELAHQQLASTDEITIPHGSWQQDYNRKQAKYNRNLIIHTLGFIGLWYWIYQSGAVKFYGQPNIQGIDIFEENAE